MGTQNNRSMAVPPSTTGPRQGALYLKAHKLNTLNWKTLVALLFVLFAAFVAPQVDVSIAENFDGEQMQAMAGGFMYRPMGRSKKGKGKASKGAESATPPSSAPDAGSGNPPRATSFKKRARSVRMDPGLGGSSGSFGGAFLRQMPLANLVGNDAFFAPSYIGIRTGTPGVDASIKAGTGNANDAYSFLSWDAASNSVKLNPRAFMVARSGEAAVQQADLARLSGWSPASAGARLMNYLRNRSVLLTEMNDDLEFLGYLKHHLDMSYQAGVYCARLMDGVLVEAEYHKGLINGKAGTTAEHSKVPYANLYHYLKPFYDRNTANLNATKVDYTLAEWMDGFCARLNNATLPDGLIGMVRPRVTLNRGMFSLGVQAYRNGYCKDNDGNNVLVLPNFEVDTDLTSSAVFQTSFERADQSAFSMDPSAPIEADLFFPSADLDESQQVTLTLFNTPLAPIQSVRSPSHDAWYDLAMGMDTVIWTEGVGADATDVTNGHLMPAVSGIYSLDNRLRNRWVAGDFVGLSNLSDWMTNPERATSWVPQQTLLTATPEEFIKELEAWGNAYPAEVQEYISHMGTVNNFDSVLKVIPETSLMEFRDHINNASRYTVRFNPANIGEWHRGPGYSRDIENRYYVQQDMTFATAAQRFSERFADQPLLLGDGTMSIASETNIERSIANFVPARQRAHLFPGSATQAKKGQRTVAVPANVSTEGVLANGTSQQSGREWIECLLLYANSVDLDFTRRYPSTDLVMDDVRWTGDLASTTLMVRPTNSGSSLAVSDADGRSLAVTAALMSQTVPNFAGVLPDLTAFDVNSGNLLKQINKYTDIGATGPAAEYTRVSNIGSGENAGTWYSTETVFPVPAALAATPVEGDLPIVTIASAGGGKQALKAEVLPTGTMVLGEESFDLIIGAGSPASASAAGISPLYLAPQEGSIAVESPFLPAGQKNQVSGNNPALGSQAGYGLDGGQITQLLGTLAVENGKEAGLSGLAYNIVNAAGVVYRTASTPEGEAPAGDEATLRVVPYTLTVRPDYRPVLHTRDDDVLFLRENIDSYNGVGCVEVDEWQQLPGQLASMITGLADPITLSGVTPQRTMYHGVMLVANTAVLYEGANAVSRIPQVHIQVGAVASFDVSEELGNLSLNGGLTISALTDIDSNLPGYRADVSQADGLWTGCISILAYNDQEGATLLDPAGTGVLAHAEPRRIIANTVSNVYHPEYDEADAATLFASTDSTQRFAWIEGPYSSTCHGKKVPFKYATLERHQQDLHKQEYRNNPLTAQNMARLRFNVSPLTGVPVAVGMEEQENLSMLLALTGLPNLTRQIIYDIEERSSRSDA